MNIKEINAVVKLELTWSQEFPHTLSIVGPHGQVDGKNGGIYFCERSRVNTFSVVDALSYLFPQGAEISGGVKQCPGKAWVTHSDTKAIKALAGQTLTVRFSIFYEVKDDGRMRWIQNKAEIVK